MNIYISKHKHLPSFRYFASHIFVARTLTSSKQRQRNCFVLLHISVACGAFLRTHSCLHHFGELGGVSPTGDWEYDFLVRDADAQFRLCMAPNASERARCGMRDGGTVEG